MINPSIDLDINVDHRPFFVHTNLTVNQHNQAQTINLPRYLVTLFALDENSVEIGEKAKDCTMAAAWSRHNYNLVNNL